MVMNVVYLRMLVIRGVDKRPENEGKDLDWCVASRRGQEKKMREGECKDLAQYIEKVKASVRAKVEHPFHVVKNIFHHRKTCYRELAMNGH